MGKVIFLDIDGTIRDFDGFIPESAREAIRSARASGHTVCISSARPYCQIDPAVLSIGFDGVISSAGAYVLYRDQCVSHLFFSQEEADEICRFLIGHYCLFELSNRSETAVLRSMEQDYQAMSDRIQVQLGPKAAKLLSDHRTIDRVSDITEIEKILYFTSTLPSDAVHEALGHLVHDVAFHISNCPERGGEITPKAAHKANGIAAVLSAGGFLQEDVIAVGDSGNDIEMLNLAAVGVAMGNGTSALKQIADLVTAPLREDGLKRAFETLKLI